MDKFRKYRKVATSSLVFDFLKKHLLKRKYEESSKFNAYVMFSLDSHFAMQFSNNFPFYCNFHLIQITFWAKLYAEQNIIFKWWKDILWWPNCSRIYYYCIYYVYYLLFANFVSYNDPLKIFNRIFYQC